MKLDSAYYEALRTRDPRFDGKFFVGVKTTGIYCRPICPAKPRRENTEFFPNHLEAEKSGYRPCLRCRPESAPQSPAWIGKSAVVRRAVKILNSYETIEFDEDQFASLFGVTARHLRRLFIEEIGKTPKQLSFENRLNLARKLLVETSLSVADVAFASGYRSIRRFNDSFKERFKRSPKEIRKSRAKPQKGLIVSISYRPPFDFEGLLRSYQNHRIGNLEWFAEGKMYRVVALGGQVGQIAISNDPVKFKVMVEIDFPDTSQIHAIVARVKTLFDLNSDPIIVANSLEIDHKTTALLKKYPGIRLPSGWDPFEVAVGAILGQLVSVEQGRLLLETLIENLGETSGIEVNGKPVKLFPTPLALSKSSLKGLRTTEARKKTLNAFARAIVKGELSLEATQDVEQFVKNVTAIPGIGAWTASYMALKVLRHTDAFPMTDLILARALKIHPKKNVLKMSPWRGYAAALYWREYAGVLKKEKKR